MKRVLPILSACLGALCACATPSPSRDLSLRRVVLYQNGIGYFERSGELRGDRFRLRLRNHEVGDVLKTLMVIDRASGRQRAVSAVLPQASAQKAEKPEKGDGEAADTSWIDILLSDAGTHELTVAYAVPTPVWKAAYRVVLPDEDARGDEAKKGLLQAWAVIDNASGDSWSRVQMTLATGAPLTFALDLRTPQFVARPDVTGQLVRPTATGAVMAERVPAVDSDGDRIPDAEDKCPNEPETYNGFEDTDGCPDRGRVVVTDSHIEILDLVYFTKNSAEVRPQSLPIVDAVAATLKGNPQILRMEVQGHASSDEEQLWALAERRAAVVRSALVSRGVDPKVLYTRGYGDSRPVRATKTEADRERQRRVEFLIARRADDTKEEVKKNQVLGGSITADAAAASTRSAATPQDVAGAARYTLDDPVTIPQGSSTMVSIVNQLGTSEDVYLFRPDGAVPGSDLHPLRAARLHTPVALEPGPVAVFARGSFVGEGLVGRLHAGDNAFVPYALDSSASVRVEAKDEERPLRLISLKRGVATVEDAAIHTTRYDIQVGQKPPARMYLRHARRAGHTTAALPPETETTAEAHLLPVPLAAAKSSVISVEERMDHRRDVALADHAEQLAPYLAAGGIPQAAARRLRDLLAQRTEEQKHADEIEQLRTRLSALSEHSSEIRDNLHTIEKMPSAAALRQQLLARLGETSKQIDQISQQLVAHTEAEATAHARINQTIIELEIEDAAAPAK